MKRRKTMKKSSSITKLVATGVLIVVGALLSLVSFRFPFNINVPLWGGVDSYNSFVSQIRLGIDLVGGIYAIYEADEDDATADLDARMDGTRAMLQNMIVGMGFTEATVVREGADRIRVEVPDVDNPQEIFRIIGQPARLEFRINGVAQGLTGDHVTRARPVETHDGPSVQLELNSEGARIFYEITRDNRGQQMQIVTIIDDRETVVSSPTINDPIPGGTALITGMQTFELARNLSDQIMSGTFAVTLRLLSTDVVAPTLGANALVLSIVAGVIGVLLTMIFLCFFYRLMGGAASISLIIYVIVMLFLFAVVPWVQLTLPGIAGKILSIGIAVDANIIIFERIKDEYRRGKSMNAAYHTGFRRALRAIMDSHVTSLIAGLVLFIVGTGPVQSFALVFMLGIAVDLFVNFFFTRMLVKNFFNIAGDRPGLFRLRRGKDVEIIPDEPVDNKPRREELEPIAVV